MQKLLTLRKPFIIGNDQASDQDQPRAMLMLCFFNLQSLAMDQSGELASLSVRRAAMIRLGRTLLPFLTFRGGWAFSFARLLSWALPLFSVEKISSPILACPVPPLLCVP
jgi:hypothetical protein